MDKTQDISISLIERLRGLRRERGYSLEVLAERAGVSRSMISLIERGESSPTAAVLHRLATGLGVSLASLFAEMEHPEASPLSRPADQLIWCDPETGYVRRNLSPSAFSSPIQLVEIILPGGARVTYDTPVSMPGLYQQIWVLEGCFELMVGGEVFRLEAGDCLAMKVEQVSAFFNPAAGPARYLVALANMR